MKKFLILFILLSIQIKNYNLVLFLPLYSQTLSDPNTIINHIKNKEWEKANSGLTVYRSENPDKPWTYSSGIWVLENLEKYDEAMDLGKLGTEKWPKDESIQKSYSQVIYKKAKSLESTYPSSAEAYDLLIKSYHLFKRDFVLAAMITNLRENKKYKEALDRIEEGNKNFPKSEYFSNMFPYTRYLYFKEILESKNLKEIKTHIQIAIDSLDSSKKLSDQFYPMRTINLGLRELKDREYFEKSYSHLKNIFKNDPMIYDEYGFQVYAIYRTHNQFNKDLMKIAIDSRKKAYSVYWKKHPLPTPVLNLGFPLKGKTSVWSSFGGSTMTHNGFAHYCYDFATVDNNKNIKKPGTNGTSNNDYYMFGQPIYAVADGVVSGVIDEFPDNTPGGYSAEANTITINHGKFLSFYAHNQFSTSLVKEGDAVKKGQHIGFAGNSGMSSESHLHFCLYKNSKEDQEPITIPFHFEPTEVLRDSETLKNSKEPYKEDDIVFMK